MNRRLSGIDPEWNRLHIWIRKTYGKANHCENDPSHKGRFEWANLSGEYKWDISDYKQLCKSCHIKLDMPEGGYKRTISNGKMRKRTIFLKRTAKEQLFQQYKNGLDSYTLSIMYGITERTVWNILKKAKEGEQN